VIERICQTLGYSSTEEVIRVLGYLDVNSIAVRGELLLFHLLHVLTSFQQARNEEKPCFLLFCDFFFIFEE
jgi:hypothetical protein